MLARYVMIVHPDPDQRRRLRAALGPVEVVEAATRQEAARLMTHRRPTLVLAHHAEFKKLLKELERHAPAAVRAVLFPHSDEAVRQALVDVAAQGYDFLTVDESSMDAVATLLDGRGSARVVPPVPLTAHFRLGLEAVTCPVAEVGSDGLGLLVSPQVPLARLTPGTPLFEAVVEGPVGVVMQARSWVVQTVVPALSGRGTHLGVTVEPPRQSERPSITISDEVRIRGLMRRAVARGLRFHASLATGAHPRSFERAVLERSGTLALLRTRPDLPFSRGDLALVAFELGGHQVESLCAVVDVLGRDLVVSLPRTVVRRTRRSSLRIHFDSDERALVHLRSPLADHGVTSRLLDLHGSGAAFTFDPRQTCLPQGLVLELGLEVAGRRVPAVGVVQTTGPVVPGPGEGPSPLRRCGVRFVSLTDDDRQFLLDRLVAAIVPDAHDASTQPFARVWSLFEEQGVVFPDYPHHDAAALATLEGAHRKLGNGAGGLSKAFVHRSDGELVGHASGLRIYSRTWLSQHLLVRAGYHRQTHVSEALVNLTFEYGEALPDVEYLRGLWRSSNRWTSRIYGATTARLLRPGHSSLAAFTPLRLAVAATLAPTSLTVRPLEPGPGCAPLLWHLRQTEDPVRLAADDLVEGELHLEGLSRRYAARGLHRARRFAVVEGRHGPRGYLIAEESTDGLFWAEWYNAYRLVLLEPQAADAAEVCRALAGWAQGDAARRGRRAVELLAPDDAVPLVEALGFSNLGRVLEFTAHRSLVSEMTAQLRAVFEPLADRELAATAAGAPR